MNSTILVWKKIYLFLNIIKMLAEFAFIMREFFKGTLRKSDKNVNIYK